jgi:hypothetical protein
MRLHPSEEFPLLDRKLWKTSPMEQTPECVPEDRPNQPAEEEARHGYDAEGDEGIGGDELCELVLDGGGFGQGDGGGGAGGKGEDQRGDEGVAAAGFAEEEEGVPI